MHKILFSFACFCLSNIMFAQTPSQNLEKAVNLFEEFKELTASDATDFEIEEQDLIYDEAIELLKLVEKDGNGNEYNTAIYFETLFKYEYAVSSLYIKDYDLAYEYLLKIEKPVLEYTSNNFPIRYTKGTSNYIIEWDNFKNTQPEMLSMLIETCFNLYKQDELIEYFKMYKANSYRTDYLDYVCYNLLLESIDPSGVVGDLLKKINNLGNDTPKFTPLEMTEFSLVALKGFDKLSQDVKNELIGKKINTTEQALSSLLKYVDSTNAQSLSNLANGLYIIAKNNPKQKNVLYATNICLKNFSSLSLSTNEIDFLRQMNEMAKINFEVMKDTAKIIGVNATNLLSKRVINTNCSLYSEIVSNYKFWNETQLALEYATKYDSCIEEQNKIAKKNARISKRADANRNIYAGVYVLPLINSNEKRDFGGVLNITNNKLSYEFSYLKINQNKENTFDLWIREVDGSSQKDFSLWNGYYTHFQLKIHENKEAPYIGLLVGYANKDFEPYKVNVINNTTLNVTNTQFDPSVNQYIGMINFGIMKLRKGIGIDAYYGFGVNYSEFKNGTNLDLTANTIQNPSLQNRKDTYFGFIMRFGLTFGLNFGKGN